MDLVDPGGLPDGFGHQSGVTGEHDHLLDPPGSVEPGDHLGGVLPDLIGHGDDADHLVVDGTIIGVFPSEASVSAARAALPSSGTPYWSSSGGLPMSTRWPATSDTMPLPGTGVTVPGTPPSGDRFED